MTGVGNGGQADAYQALRESEALHRATLSNISDAVFLVDDEGTFKWVCPNVDVIFGYAPDEVYELSKLDRLLGGGLFDHEELAAAGEIRNVEREVIAKGGDVRSLLIHLKRVAINGGTVLCTCRDVTDLRHAERDLATARLELAHAARLALVGQLLTSMAHEIQQPVTSIDLSVKAGLKALDTVEEATSVARLRGALQNIAAAAKVADAIIHELRSFGRKRSLDLQAVDMNGVTHDVLRLVRADAVRRGVTLRAELSRSLPPVVADRTGMQQVILDLIVNAMDAMQDVEGERRVTVQTRPRNGSVEIAVRDWGHGVAPDHRSRLFEPFFTTKDDGVGLGLAISNSIVAAHGGHLSLDERVRRGATFRVTLPQQAPAPGA